MYFIKTKIKNRKHYYLFEHAYYGNDYIVFKN